MNFVSRLVPTRIEPIGRLVVSLGGLERITSNFLAPSRPTKFTQVRNGVHSDAKTVRLLLLLLLILIDVCLHGLLASPHRTSHSSGAMLGNYAQTCLIFHKPAVFQHTPKICHHSFSSPSNQHGRRRPWDSLPESIDRRSPVPKRNKLSTVGERGATDWCECKIPENVPRNKRKYKGAWKVPTCIGGFRWKPQSIISDLTRNDRPRTA